MCVLCYHDNIFLHYTNAKFSCFEPRIADFCIQTHLLMTHKISAGFGTNKTRHSFNVNYVSGWGKLILSLSILDSKKVQVGKDQEKAQSEKDSHSKNRGWKKTN